jgi:hypothetical protein
MAHKSGCEDDVFMMIDIEGHIKRGSKVMVGV